MRETDHFQHFMEKFLPYAEKKTSSIMICVYGVQAAHSATSHIILPCVWTIISAFDRRFWDLKILATDISLNALRSAKNGIYTSMSIKNIPEDWRKKIFSPIFKHKGSLAGQRYNKAEC